MWVEGMDGVALLARVRRTLDALNAYQGGRCSVHVGVKHNPTLSFGGKVKRKMER